MLCQIMPLYKDGVFGVTNQIMSREDVYKPAEMHDVFGRAVVSSAKKRHQMAGVQEDARVADTVGISRVVEVPAIPDFESVYSWQVS